MQISAFKNFQSLIILIIFEQQREVLHLSPDGTAEMHCSIQKEPRFLNRTL